MGKQVIDDEPCVLIERSDAADGSRSLMKIVIATSLLNGLELFDFSVFGLFAAMIGDQFFPSVDPMTSLLFAVATFGVGFLFRPVGAIVIGAYADRAGRRRALLATSWMATLGTAAIVLCPPYAALGVAAPLIVVLARVLQGLAIGGEMGAAAALVVEAASPALRGRAIGSQLAGNALAPLLGASLGSLLGSILSPEQLTAWGWRVAFAFALPLLAVGYYLRRQFLANDAPRAHTAGYAVRRRPGRLARHHIRTLILATLSTSFSTVSFYSIVYYMPAWLNRVMHKNVVTGFLSTAFSGLLIMMLAPPSGWLADRLPRRKPLVIAVAAALAAVIPPIFYLIIHTGTATILLAGVACITALVAVGGCVVNVLILEAWPQHVRASGYGIGYAVGTALFGGTAQLVVTALVNWSGNPMAVAWYATPCCLLSVGALLCFKEERADA